MACAERSGGSVARAHVSALTERSLRGVPVTRDVLERIAQEERSHTELSWRVVAFCVERGGASRPPRSARLLFGKRP